MTWGFVAVAAATVVVGAIQANQQKQAAKGAANAQKEAAQSGIQEQSREFDAIQQLLAPYNAAGTAALTGQSNLIGLGGPEAQKQAIQGIQQGPEYGALLKSGENAILQNASATGGLRGGNTQGALAQFAPNLLSQLIQQRFQNLGGLTSIGQNAAAMTGNAGQNTANQITQLLQQQGAANAGQALAVGGANANYANTISNLGGLYASYRNNQANNQNTQGRF